MESTFSTSTNNGTNGAYTFATGVDAITSNNYTGSNWKPTNNRRTTANVSGKLYEGNVHDKVRAMHKRNEL